MQVTWTTIKAWMSSNFGRIPQLTSELAALERLKKRHIILLALMRFIFDRIFFILAGIEDNHNITDEFEIGRFRPQTLELAALERLKNIPMDL